MDAMEAKVAKERVLMISDAAREVHVETHVLRYWEEELHLPIKRNELGHRYYTREDVERFCRIKRMKDKGLQLKAIRAILQNMDQKQTDSVQQAEYCQPVEKGEATGCAMQECCPDLPPAGAPQVPTETREEKAQRLQWILTQLIRQTVQESNEELVRSIRDSVVKELDYQFRMQEEREEARARILSERSEEYYRRLDELLRSKGGKFPGKPFAKPTFPKGFPFGSKKQKIS